MTDLHVLDELESRLTQALYSERVPRRVARRRWLLPLGGLAAATAAAVVLAVVLVGAGSVETPIAAALDRAADAARQGPATPAVGPGQLWYTRVSGVERLPIPLVTRPLAKGAIPSTVAIVQRVTTETWVGLDGTIRTRTVPLGEQRFATPQDRARWLASGTQLPHLNLGNDSTAQGDGRFPPGLDLFRYRELLALPTDPHALYARIHGALAASQARMQQEFDNTQKELKRQQAAGGNSGVNYGASSIAGGPDAQAAAELSAIKELLQSPVPPAVRAALYRAAALIPGVRYDGHVQDALGRAGVGVSVGKPEAEFELIFDPASGALLGQHSPVIGDSATAATGVVDSITEVPDGSAPIPAPASIAHVPIAIRPALGDKRTTFAVHLRQGVSRGMYSFWVTGPSGPACRQVLLPVTPPRFVAGSRAGRALVHRLRPPAGGWCTGSYQAHVAISTRGNGGEVGSVRFRVR
jgi:hypothetical protein